MRSLVSVALFALLCVISVEAIQDDSSLTTRVVNSVDNGVHVRTLAHSKANPSSGSKGGSDGGVDSRIGSLKTRVEQLESNHEKFKQLIASDQNSAANSAAQHQEQQYANVDTTVPTSSYASPPDVSHQAQDLQALEQGNTENQEFLNRALALEQQADGIAAQKDEALRKYEEHKQQQATHSTIATDASAKRDEANGQALNAERELKDSVFNEPGRIHKDGAEVQKANEDIIDYRNQGDDAAYKNHVEAAKANELSNQANAYQAKAETEAKIDAAAQKKWEQDEQKITDLNAALGTETADVKAAETEVKGAQKKADQAVKDKFHWGDIESREKTEVGELGNKLDQAELDEKHWQGKVDQYGNEAQNFADQASRDGRKAEDFDRKRDAKKEEWLDAKNGETEARADYKVAEFKEDKLARDLAPKQLEMDHAKHEISQDEMQSGKLATDIASEEHRIQTAEDKLRELAREEAGGKNELEDAKADKKEAETDLTAVINQGDAFANALSETDDKLKHWERLLSNDQQELQQLLAEEQERKVKERTAANQVTATSKKENALSQEAQSAEKKMMQDRKAAQTAPVADKGKMMDNAVIANMEQAEKNQELSDVRASNDGAANQRQYEFAELQDAANSVQEAQAKVDRDTHQVNDLKSKETELEAKLNTEKTEKAQKKGWLSKAWDGIKNLKTKVVDWARKKLGLENTKREAMAEKARDEKAKEHVDHDVSDLKEELVKDQEFVHTTENQLDLEQKQKSDAQKNIDAQASAKDKAKTEADDYTNKAEEWHGNADQASEKEHHFEKEKGKAETEESAARERLKHDQIAKADAEHGQHEAEQKEQEAADTENEAQKQVIEGRAKKEHAEEKKRSIENDLENLQQQAADEKFHLDNMKDQQDRDAFRYHDVQAKKTSAENQALDAALTEDNMKSNVDTAEKDLEKAQDDHSKIGAERPELRNVADTEKRVSDDAGEEAMTSEEKAIHHGRLAEVEKAKATRLAAQEAELRRQAQEWRSKMQQ